MTLDMTQGRPGKLLMRFAVPLMLSAMLQQMYTLCDSLIIGRLLGTVAFTASSSAGNVNWFPLHILLGATNSFGVALAQRFGARNREEFHKFFGNSIVLSLGLGLIFSVIGLIFATDFLRLLNTPAELFDLTLQYLRVLWIGFPVTAILNIFTATLLAIGDSRTPLVSLAVSSVVNILLDLVFLAWLNMGVTGAALATVIAQATAALLSFLNLRRAEDSLPKREHFRLQPYILKELLRLSLPRMLCNGVTTSGELLVQAAVNSWGVEFVTGLTASRKYLNLLNVAGYGLEGSLATFVGQNWGAGKNDRICQGTRTAVRLGLLTAAATSIIVALFAEPMIRFFIAFSPFPYRIVSLQRDDKSPPTSGRACLLFCFRRRPRRCGVVLLYSPASAIYPTLRTVLIIAPPSPSLKTSSKGRKATESAPKILAISSGV